MNEKLLGVFARLTGQSAESFAEDLKEDGDVSDLEQRLNEAVKAKIRSARDEGYKRGEKEVKTTVEKQIAAKFKIEDYTDFDDLIAKIQKPDPIASPDLTPDMIRKTEIYAADLKALKEAKKALEEEFTKFRDGIKVNELRNNLQKRGLEILKMDKFHLPENEKILSRRLGEFVDDLLVSADFTEVEGTLVPLVKGSNDRLKDNLHNNIDFAQLVKSVGEGIFEMRQGDGGTPPPAPGSTPPPAGGNTKFGIKDYADYSAKLATLDKIEDIQALQSEFEALTINN